VVLSYQIKSIFYTLQGEGARAGRPSVFCRFAGCNLWSGREAHRSGAICQFCDTDFVGTDGPGGGTFRAAAELARAVAEAWPGGGAPYVVCTGGEPLLQLDAELVAAFHERGFEVAVETNGTREPPAGVDWLCVSPKAGAPLVLTRGDELKLIYPQAGLMPEDLPEMAFRHYCLQPMDAGGEPDHTDAAAEYCLAHPQWRLSLQTHKYLGLP
jgi:7-carboxy-7-deazaguanine synthase (Cx14CxxC type)